MRWPTRWPLQPLQPLQRTQLQPSFGPSVDSFCDPWFTTTNLPYRFPIFETSATALCGTTGIITYIPIATLQKDPKRSKTQLITTLPSRSSQSLLGLLYSRCMKQCIPVPIFRARASVQIRRSSSCSCRTVRCCCASARACGLWRKMGASKKELAWFTTPIPRVYGTYFLVILTYSNYN